MKNNKTCINSTERRYATTPLTASHQKALRDQLREMKLFTTAEDAMLANALSKTSPDGTFSETELTLVFQWANRVRFLNTVLELVLSGCMGLSVRSDGDIAFVPIAHPTTGMPVAGMKMDGISDSENAK